MPAAYTHEAFGEEVYASLTGEIKEIVTKEKDLFTIGFQGPDIFFFYHPLKSNPVSKIGTAYHNKTGRQVLTEMLKQLKVEDPMRESKLAYISGLICHFVLDASCHAYINAFSEEKSVSHTDIEMELDRHTLVSLGKDPLAEFLAENIHPSRHAAEAIAPMYAGINEKTAFDALKDFVKFHKIMLCPKDGKRNFLYGLMRLIGKYDSLHGHIIAKNANPVCAESNEEITRRRKEAVPLAVRLIEELASESDELLEENILLRDFNGVEYLQVHGTI